MHKETINNQKIVQINEQMDATDAYGLMVSIIDARIKYYNRLYLRHWERNHDTKKDFYNAKIEELKAEKAKLMDFAQDANASQKTISLNGDIRLMAV